LAQPQKSRVTGPDDFDDASPEPDPPQAVSRPVSAIPATAAWANLLRELVKFI
jgi:hypothetical protein